MTRHILSILRRYGAWGIGLRYKTDNVAGVENYRRQEETLTSCLFLMPIKFNSR